MIFLEKISWESYSGQTQDVENQGSLSGAHVSKPKREPEDIQEKISASIFHY